MVRLLCEGHSWKWVMVIVFNSSVSHQCCCWWAWFVKAVSHGVEEVGCAFLVPKEQSGDGGRCIVGDV